MNVQNKQLFSIDLPIRRRTGVCSKRSVTMLLF